MHTVHKALVTTPTETVSPAVVEIDDTGANVRAKSGEFLFRVDGSPELITHNTWQIGETTVKRAADCGCGPTKRKPR